MKTILFILLSIFLVDAHAAEKTIVDVANNLISYFNGANSLVLGSSYIIGLITSTIGVIKLKEHNESKGQVKIGIPITLIVAGALMLALPSFGSVAKETFGVGGEATSALKGVSY